MLANNPILVTGAPRSGTTWVGRMIGQAPFIRYIHEPFNITSQLCQCGVKFDYWFYYLTPKSQLKFHPHLKHTIYPAFSRIGLLNSILEIRRTKQVRPFFRYLQSYLFSRPVLKDPLALFSAEQLADSFNMDVVVLIRHPAAIISSYKTLNWTHPFSHFLNQSALLEDHLAPFRSEVEDFTKKEHDIVDQAALLWKLIHFMIIKYQKTHPGWIFIRHKDLALDPIIGFQKIFARLNLPFSKHACRVIQNHIVKEQLPNSTDPYAIKQNPRQVITKWQKNLTSEEINRIRERVEEVSSAFYTDADWNPEPVSNKW